MSRRDLLWRDARRSMGRRQFLAMLLAGGTAAVLAACRDDVPSWSPTSIREGDTVTPDVFKDPAPFIQRGRSGLESRLELQDTYLTPLELFFVRNNSRSVRLELQHWRLRVEGDAVSTPLTLTFEDILRLPQRNLTAYLECAGNQRAMFDYLQGRPASGTQWGRGAVGNASWSGPALTDILTLAGVADDARSVLLIGADRGSPEQGFRRALPIDKARHPDTLLAHRMNGQALRIDHGFPLRAVAPGWVGASQIKWLEYIVVSREPHWTRNNTTSYVLIGDDHPPQGEADGQPITEQSIKSALALPWPAQLEPGPHRLHGFAHSPHGAIDRVEWSLDGGQSWRRASISEQAQDYGWTVFELRWEATPGEHTIMTRATDLAGRTQPDRVPFNEKGYLFNQPLPHPVVVR